MTTANPRRLVRIIERTIRHLDLNLSGLTILTEAASGPYTVTPVIAAAAKAERVVAITRDSAYATADEVVTQTRALQHLCGAPDVIDIRLARTLELFRDADIVTNLGFVRPIDSAVITVLRPTAVICSMFEKWELRDTDIDIAACQDKGIAVTGTNEHSPRLPIFTYSGPLCMRLLIEAQIEVVNSVIAVVSSDAFGTTITEALRNAGAQVRLLPHLRDVLPKELAAADALVVADFERGDSIIGRGGDIEAEVLAAEAPHLTIVPFAGRVDAGTLLRLGMLVHPNRELRPHTMAMTFGGLGPRPVVELNSASLKAGQILANAIKLGRLDDQWLELVQLITRPPSLDRFDLI